ncbi:hypothetical protein LMG27174_02693 [Paraburkholderia rhynchosiae]|uniref:Uncharacterized protein n=1 Tax=Paraburkholderia rhynchosiae TaxID=487049 RepID=A0A2N7WVT6_9BURK|nr:hypothetical protein C0Z16_02505 [Paraburkholderia rhynchosiae]CAB3681524.1 hypothetical protein LMG27174_02693 [Paraburkholderia rhynchosiae]
MKWTIGTIGTIGAVSFRVLLVSAGFALLIARSPTEQAIRLAGYAATAAFAALISFEIPRRNSRARRSKRAV